MKTGTQVKGKGGGRRRIFPAEERREKEKVPAAHLQSVAGGPRKRGKTSVPVRLNLSKKQKKRRKKGKEFEH